MLGLDVEESGIADQMKTTSSERCGGVWERHCVAEPPTETPAWWQEETWSSRQEKNGLKNNVSHQNLGTLSNKMNKQINKLKGKVPEYCDIGQKDMKNCVYHNNKSYHFLDP